MKTVAEAEPAAVHAADRRPRTAAIVNLGCKVNQSEMEAAARLLREASVPLVDPDRRADLYLVNTCTVTANADEKSRAAVRRARRANPEAEIVVTGCSVQVGPAAFTAVDVAARLVRNDDKAAFLAELEGLLRIPGTDGSAGTPHGPIAAALPTLSGVEAVAAATLDGVADDRASVERTRAFVKVQDGCDRRCAYCIVPSARSGMSSKPAAAALAEIKGLAAAGFGEIVLCGTRLGMYKCPDSGADLSGLMKLILERPGGFRIRFSSLEPGEISEGLAVVLAAGAERFCDYFHLPMQSGSDSVLKAMGRPYDSAGYLDKLRLLRRHFGTPGLYADIIAGYPTETDGQFAETLAFVRKCRLAGLHVFRFSGRPGTKACMLKPLSRKIVSGRAAALRAMDAELRAAYAASMRGRVLRVLTLRNKEGGALGLASNFLQVGFQGGSRPGSFVNAQITGILPGRGACVCSGEPI